MEYLIAIVPILLIFILRNRYSTILLNPTSVLCLTWLGFLILHMLFAQNYYFSWRVALVILFYVSAFSIGEFAVVVSYRMIQPVFSYDNYSKYYVSRLKLVIILMSIISAIGFILYLKSFIDYYGTLQNLLDAGNTIRLSFKVIKISLFTRMLLLIGYSAAILSLVYYITNGIKLFITIPFVILLLMGVVQSGRAGFILLIVFVFFAIYWRDVVQKSIFNLNYSVNKRLLKRALFLVLIAIIIFILGYLQRVEDLSFERALDKGTFSNFKIYLLGGISSFDSWLRDPQTLDLGYGRYSFSAIYDLLGIAENKLGVYTKYYPISAEMHSGINIFTSFRPLIDDFGIFGGAVFMFVLGIFGGIVFNKAMNGRIPFLATLIVLYGYLFHTPLLPITVHTSIVLCFFIPFIIIEGLRLGFKNRD